MINNNHEDYQYNSGDLVYIISPLTSQLRTSSRKVTIKYVGPLVVYKIVDPHNYLLMTLDGKILRGLFEFERIKPAIIRTSHGNVNTLAQLKQVLSLGIILIEMQMLKCLNLFASQCTYHDYLNFMGTLQQGNRLIILAILVIIFFYLHIILYVMRNLL